MFVCFDVWIFGLLDDLIVLMVFSVCYYLVTELCDDGDDCCGIVCTDVCVCVCVRVCV